MNELLSGDLAERITGVIDLLDGRAVHAIAGRRDNYRPLGLWDGDPVALAQHYCRQGISSIYVADLDAIGGRDIQTAVIHAISQSTADREILVDIGWTGGKSNDSRALVAHLTREDHRIRWIAATESCRSTDAIAELTAVVSGDRVLLGLDYCKGRLLSTGAEEDEWIDRAMQVGCRGAVILDLASVGTAQGPVTVDACKRVRQRARSFSIYSGGGVRASADLHQLIRAGCDRCLVATALHREIRTPKQGTRNKLKQTSVTRIQDKTPD